MSEEIKGNPNIEDEAAIIMVADYLLERGGISPPPPGTMAELVDDAIEPLSPGTQSSAAAGFGHFGHFGSEAIEAAKFVVEAIIAGIHLNEIKHLMGPKVLVIAKKLGSVLENRKKASELVILTLAASPQIGRELWESLPAAVRDKVSAQITSALSALKTQDLSPKERKFLESLEQLDASLKK